MCKYMCMCVCTHTWIVSGGGGGSIRAVMWKHQAIHVEPRHVFLTPSENAGARSHRKHTGLGVGLRSLWQAAAWTEATMRQVLCYGEAPQSIYMAFINSANKSASRHKMIICQLVKSAINRKTKRGGRAEWERPRGMLTAWVVGEAPALSAVREDGQWIPSQVSPKELLGKIKWVDPICIPNKKKIY